MDYYEYPSRFSMSSFSLFGDFFEKVKDFCNFAVSAIIGNIFAAILTFFFALGWFLSLFFHVLLHCFFKAFGYLVADQTYNFFFFIGSNLILDLFIALDVGFAIN